MLLKLMGVSVLSLSSALALTGLTSDAATKAAGCPCPSCDCGADCGCSETGACDCGRGCCVDGCETAHAAEFAVAAFSSPKTATQPAPACCGKEAACCEKEAACCEPQAADLAGCPGCAGVACQEAGCSADGCCEGDCDVASCECAAGCCEAGCCAK
ncbi:MAG: hypothetical protein WBC44_07175 [Planctomycetaceae bacterium]